ncbi:putative gustatory receptor 93c [Drosophila pseudoobscura]|uniref:Gustatory receptor n=1 Tax=Drosophila pseudoobscura pseudoobscura TaxID=46245 RepID=A0A6I8VNQ9_DROPS|nr:putative gustatory receptor 93c [Drosophila pseudoobscura]
MFGVLRKMNASKLSAGILLVMYYHAIFMGIFSFKLQRHWISENGQMLMELRALPRPGLMRFYAIYRILAIAILAYFYLPWILRLEIFFERLVHFIRIITATLVCVCILRLQLLHKADSKQLMNTFFRLFRRVRALPSRKTFGYGGRRELVLLSLALICRIHELVYILESDRQHFSMERFLSWWCDTFIVFGINMMMQMSFVCYLSIGILYSELNDFVRFQLRSELQALKRPHGLQPRRQHLRTVRRKLSECLALYREIYALATTFQKLTDFPFFLSIVHNYTLLGVVIYRLTIVGWFDKHKIQLSILTTKVILDFFLVTMAVEGAMTQFRVIRRLSLENCYISDHKDWHTTFDMFVTHLSLYEFRVRVLGLFDVSNELVLIVLSALVTFVIYVVQYRMQSTGEAA